MPEVTVVVGARLGDHVGRRAASDLATGDLERTAEAGSVVISERPECRLTGPPSSSAAQVAAASPSASTPNASL